MPRGWYDARGTGFCDDYGRFVNVGQYQFDGEDNSKAIRYVSVVLSAVS